MVRGDDSRPESSALLRVRSSGGDIDLLAEDLDRGFGVGQEVAIPLWVGWSASPRGNDHVPFAIAQIQQRDYVWCGSFGAGRGEQQHVVVDKPFSYSSPSGPKQKHV